MGCVKNTKLKLEKEPEHREWTQGNLWCPFAVQPDKKMPTRGKYPLDYPYGAIVHHTAGRAGMGVYHYGIKQGYAYLYIDRDGSLYQGFPLDRWGYHAGKSAWHHKLVKGTVSNELVGIEIAGAGLLKKEGPGVFKTWWGGTVPEANVRYVNNKQRPVAGYYEAFTSEQEQTLCELLAWLYINRPAVFDLDLILGHDEVSPGRKNDPGGSLSMSMDELRSKIKQMVER